MRVHELAKELGVESKDVLVSLEGMGFDARTASSTVPEEAVPRLRAAGGKVKPGSKPKTAEEKPVRPARSSTRTAAKAPAPAAAPPPTPAAEEGNGQVAAAAPAEAEPEAAPAAAAAPEPAPAEESPAIRVAHGATPQELADRLSSSASEIVKTLFAAGEMVSVTQSLSDEAIELVAEQLGRAVEIVAPEQDTVEEEESEVVDESRLRPRPPVVTVMGHVDHGKTLLLDAIRKTDVAGGEFGGITQHIGAYQVHRDGREITFIDTPGHEAFTAMRARGAQVTDIVVLVVAADDGVMPQTVEALNHAKAADVPIVVAVNKIDKEEANPQRVRQQLIEYAIMPPELGGENEFVDVSAKSRTNLDDLLETILLVADVQELKADPTSHARGVVIEAHLDKGRGPVATVLVQRGTLRAGDAIVCGTAFARVRAMFDENLEPMSEAGPSKPAQVLGWSHVPEAGDEFRVVADEREAKRIAQERESRHRAAEFASAKPAASSLTELLMRAREGELPVLNLIIKADVQGTLQAIVESLDKLPQNEVRVQVLHQGVGGINENDISLGAASGAIVIGFNVRPEPAARELAEKEGVDLRLYRVIYQALDDIRAALSGLLQPDQEEVELGRAEVRALFRTPRGVIAGCYVTHGNIARNSLARLVRDGAIVYTGRVGSLRRFKEDVREVAEGFECGIGLENFQDVHEGDVVETYEVREVARTLG
ncbi:MAG TPA: translation initiation factor IF-2 [Actinomycetota bacterium]